MRIERLHFYRDQFKKEIDTFDYLEPYKWECQEIFQKAWDPDALDFAMMYDQALSHPASGSLWGGNHQSAKSIMLEFIQLNREFVRSMFKDLFSRQKDLIMRIQRFQYHCDQLLEQLRQEKQKTNHHFHEGYYMPTLYLALRYPTEITIYNPDDFKRSLSLIGAKDPADSGLTRFTKVLPILQSQLQQDIDLMNVVKQKIKLQNPEFYQSLWLAHDFYTFMATKSI